MKFAALALLLASSVAWAGAPPATVTIDDGVIVRDYAGTMTAIDQVTESNDILSAASVDVPTTHVSAGIVIDPSEPSWDVSVQVESTGQTDVFEHCALSQLVYVDGGGFHAWFRCPVMLSTGKR